MQRGQSARAIQRVPSGPTPSPSAPGGGEVVDENMMPDDVVANQLYRPDAEQWLRNTGEDGHLHWVRLLSAKSEEKISSYENKTMEDIARNVNNLTSEQMMEKLAVMRIDTSDAFEKSELVDMLMNCRDLLSKMSIKQLKAALDNTICDYSTCIEKQDLVVRLSAVGWFGEGYFSDGFVRVFTGTPSNPSLDWVPAAKFTLDPYYKKYQIRTIEIEEMCSKPFNEKVKWFRKVCRDNKIKWEDGRVHIKVRRDQLLRDSFMNFNRLKPEDLRRFLRFEFLGEEGVDAGGVAREWFELVTDQCFNVDFGLFEYSGVDNICYQINPSSGIANELHEQYFLFLGRVIGKALFDQQIIRAHVTQPIFKHILGWPITMEDIEFIDPQVYRSLQDIEACEDIEDLYLDFTTNIEVFGETQTIPLKPGGEEIDVTNYNRQEYMQLKMKHIMLDRTKSQLAHFLRGVYDVIPEIWLSIFDYRELELLLCGLPNINVQDWKNNTIYKGQYASKGAKHKVIQWFWETLENANQEQRARFLQFCTGTSRVPVQGFRALQGSDGNIKTFNIVSIDLKTCMYPRAHTCFNRIELPLYKNREQLVNFVTQTINMDPTGFTME